MKNNNLNKWEKKQYIENSNKLLEKLSTIEEFKKLIDDLARS